MTKIVIVDDHPVVRDGMSAMLENESDFSVVCSAKSGEDAVDFVRKHGAPSIVIVPNAYRLAWAICAGVNPRKRSRSNDGSSS